MKKWKALCSEDGWASSVVDADTADAAADMVAGELAMHLKETHQMELPTDPAESHKAVVEHMQEVVATPGM